MMKSNLLALLVSAALVLQPIADLAACCMVPAGFAGSIGQSAQQGLIFFDEGREDLILGIDYRITGETMPDRFAWVITVPNEPDSYNLAEDDLFSGIRPWAIELVRPKPIRGFLLGDYADSRVEKGDASGGLEFGQRQIVGPYDIQPVRALGMEAFEGLNSWLSKNGFPAEASDHMVYFIKKEFTFLCVKVSPPGEQKSVNSSGSLPPLHLTFKSPAPYYPLLFSSRQGVFDLNLYLLTQEPFDYTASDQSLNKINWTAREFHRNIPVKFSSFPKKLKDTYQKTASNGADSSWYLNVLGAKDVNQAIPISTWNEDVFFKTGQIQYSIKLAIMFGVLLCFAGLGWIFVRHSKRRGGEAAEPE